MCLTNNVNESLHFAVDLKFTDDDLITAVRWAELRTLVYDSQHELLFGAMLEGQIRPSNGFEEVICAGKI